MDRLKQWIKEHLGEHAQRDKGRFNDFANDKSSIKLWTGTKQLSVSAKPSKSALARLGALRVVAVLHGAGLR
jgi:hypothetical protein